MKKKIKLFVIYFPVILVSGQVLANLLYFVEPKIYMATGFYLNLLFGTNLLFAAFLLCFTLMFRFCTVSRWAAAAECAFALNYLIVQQDNLYNILFQIIVGCGAVGLTFRLYIMKFPLCRLSLVANFLYHVTAERSCKKGVESYDRAIRSIVLKQYHETIKDRH